MLIVAGLGGLALVSLASAQWAGNPEEAYAAADRLLVYLLLAFVLLVAVRTDRAAAWLLGAVAVGAVVVMGWTIVRMLGSDADSAFLGARLHEPLGYINGQGAFFVIATWLFFAAAEQRRWPVLSGVGLAAAVLSGSLAVLSQSRGVALSALIATGVGARSRSRPSTARMDAGGTGSRPRCGAPLAAGGLQRCAGRPRRAGGGQRRRCATALVCAIVSGAVWGALTLAASRIEQQAPWAAKLAAAAVAVATAVAVGAALASAGTIQRTVSEQYDAFVHLAS